VLASITVAFVAVMSVKSEKTFEEIVERLVALFRPASLDSASASQTTEPPSDEADSQRPHSIPDTSSDDNTR
jgi:hypothetical protein